MIRFNELPPHLREMLGAFAREQFASRMDAHYESEVERFRLVVKDCGCKEITGPSGEPDMANVVDALIDAVHSLTAEGFGREIPINRLIEQRYTFAYLVPYPDETGNADALLMARGQRPTMAAYLMAEAMAALIDTIPGAQRDPAYGEAGTLAAQVVKILGDVIGVEHAPAVSTPIMTEHGVMPAEGTSCPNHAPDQMCPDCAGGTPAATVGR